MYILKKYDIAKDYNGDKWRVQKESANPKSIYRWDKSGALKSFIEEEDPFDYEEYRFAGCLGIDVDNRDELVAWAYTPFDKKKDIVLGM